MDFSNLTKFWKAKYFFVFVFSLFYSADLMAQSELKFERVINLSRFYSVCYSPNSMVRDTVPIGKIWKLETVSASCQVNSQAMRIPFILVNGTRLSMAENGFTSARVYIGNPLWLSEGTILTSSGDPGSWSGCNDCSYFYSILEFSQTP